VTKLAFDNVTGPVFTLTDELIQQGIRGSRESDRRRIILPIHRVQNAEVQRMINFLQPGTYIRPHKHPLNHATESLVLIQGAILFFTFSDIGEVETKRRVDSKPLSGVLDIEPNVWHSFIVLEPDTILFECKRGPYDAETDKIFAPWAPEEGSDEADGWHDGKV
jgi:cupin fold WbuC family metalloprotein